MSRRAGIEKIGVYPGSLALAMSQLCAARGHDPADIRDTMMIDERSVNPVWEDPVTMAVNAANPMLTEADREQIELLIVASESGVDQEKPLSTWVHRYLRLTPHCRNFEVKHACYGGTAGLHMALNWVAAGLAGEAKALVVATDQSRMHLGRPWEFVMGAGAAAALVSGTPRVLEVELGKSGYWTNEVSDLTRPTSRVETGNSETSLLSYIDALEGAYAHYLERVKPPVDFDEYFAKNIYHAPFGGMTFRAHRTLLRQWLPMSKSEAWAHFERKTLPSLQYLRRMGGAYSASTFIGLLGLIEGAQDLEPGDRISIFSYGSGSCAEFYSGIVCPEAREIVRAARLPELLDARYQLTVAEYEAVEQERTRLIDLGDYEPQLNHPATWYDWHYRGRELLVFRGMKDYYRQYGWS
jgi:3-hydroxy-3-methylglutaryl CoA synthase